MATSPCAAPFLVASTPAIREQHAMQDREEARLRRAEEQEWRRLLKRQADVGGLRSCCHMLLTAVGIFAI